MALDYSSANAIQSPVAIESLISLAGRPRAAETFVRHEEKHLLPRVLVSELEEVLRVRSEPSYPDLATTFNTIESVYYDSPSLNIYRNHFAVGQRRFKIRSRRYAPNGVWSQKSVHLELKSKDFGICEKERLRIGGSELAYLHQGLPIPLSEQLFRKNLKIGPADVALRITKINEEVARFRTRPFCRVVYERRAYEKDGFRVTFDEGIRFELLAPVADSVVAQVMEGEFWSRALAMRESFLKRESVVLELKHSGTIPAWMSAFLNNRPSEKLSFSKYCYAVTSSIMNQNAATNGHPDGASA